MKKREPVISVVIPAYNEEKRLPACLKALQNQDFKLAYEVIIVDNNSADKTAKIGRKFGARIITEAQQSIVSARQRGLIAAKGEIVAMTDADTKPPRNWLRTIYESINKKGVVAVGGVTKYFDSPKWFKWYMNLLFLGTRLFSKILGQASYIIAHNVGFKKEALLKYGGYDVRLSMAEDEWGILRKLRKAGKVVFNPNLINYASGRRAKKGILFFFWEALLKYNLDYILSLIFKRRVLNHFSAVR